MRKSIFILFFLSLSVSGFSQSPKITFHHDVREGEQRTVLNCDTRSETGFVLYDFFGSFDEVSFYPSYHTIISGPFFFDFLYLTFDAHTSPRFNDLKKRLNQVISRS